MDWTDRLRDFDYDLWANQLWLRCLLGKGLPSPDVEIFCHIAGASQIWLSRVNGESPIKFPEIEPIESELERLHRQWHETLSKLTTNPEIRYRRLNGEEFPATISDIARHVTNHGTYHRGELRGLCSARDEDDFPETDFSLFAALKNPEP